MFGPFEKLFKERLGCNVRMFVLFEKLFLVKLGCKVRMFGLFEQSFTGKLGCKARMYQIDYGKIHFSLTKSYISKRQYVLLSENH